jgi:outer membrane protein assembly factor BamA
VRAHVLKTWEIYDMAVSFGPAARWRNADVEQGSVADDVDPGGVDSHVQGGVVTRLRLDRRNDEMNPTGGYLVLSEAQGHAWSDGAPFARFRSESRGYLSAGGERGPVLALKAGGELAVGDYPFQEAAALGGFGTLRGYPTQRYLGDGALFGSAEVRLPRIARIEFITKGHLGAFAFGDAGRMYFDGDSPDGWHTAVGAGLSFLTLRRVVSFVWAYGERHTVYFHFGMPF